MKTDPYGALYFCVGTADDFICFDYDSDGERVRLHSVINSETGAFIQDFDPPQLLATPRRQVLRWEWLTRHSTGAQKTTWCTTWRGGAKVLTISRDALPRTSRRNLPPRALASSH